METVSSLGVDFGADTSRYVQASRQVSLSLDGLAGQAVKLGAALGAAFAASGAINGALQLDKTMANIRAVSGSTAAEMGNLRREIGQIGGNSTVGVQATAEAFYDIASGVTDASVRMAVLNTAVATAEAGQADLTAVTRGLINVTNAYGGSAQDVTKYSDVLTRTVGLGVGTMDEFVGALGPVSGLAANVGISFADLGDMMAFLTTQGMTASQAATQVQAGITALIKPNETMKKALKGIGVESGSAALKLYGLAGTLGRLQKSIGSADGMATALGSVEATIGAIALNKPGFEDFMRTFDNGLEGATEAARKLQLESVSAQFEIFKNRVGTIALDIGTGLITGLTRIPAIIQELWTNNVLGIPKALETAAVMLGPAAAKVREAFRGLFGDLGGIFDVTPTIAKLKPVVDTGYISEMISKGLMPDAVGKGQYSMTQAMIDQLTAAGESTDLEVAVSGKLDIAGKIRAVFQKWWPEITKAITEFGGQIGKFLVENLGISPAVIDAVGKIGGEFLRPISEGFKTLGTINWENVGKAGLVITGVAGGVAAFKPLVGLFARFEAFNMFTKFLQELSNLVDDLSKGNAGAVLGDVARGALALGSAAALFSIAGGMKGGGAGAAIAGATGAGTAALTGAGAEATAAVTGGVGILKGIAKMPLWQKMGFLALGFNTLLDLLGNPEVQAMPGVWLKNLQMLTEIAVKFPGKLAEDLRNRIGQSNVGAYISSTTDAQKMLDAQAIMNAGKKDTKAPIVPAPTGAGAVNLMTSGLLPFDKGKIIEIDTQMRAEITQGWELTFGTEGTLATIAKGGIDANQKAYEAWANVLKGIFAGGDLRRLMTQPFTQTVKTIGGILAGLGGIQGMPGPLASIGAAIIGVASLFEAKATGGWVNGGQTYMVGERGPELFSPGRSGYITPNNQLGAGGGPMMIKLMLDGRQIYEVVLNERDIRNRRGW